eukprot:1808864-Amphidinium_carterae.1
MAAVLPSPIREGPIHFGYTMLRRLFRSSSKPFIDPPAAMSEVHDSAHGRTGDHSPITPEELVRNIEPTKKTMEEISNALKRKRMAGSKAGDSRASSAETTIEKRIAQEKDKIPPPPAACPPPPTGVPIKAAPRVKDFSSLKGTPQQQKKKGGEPDEEPPSVPTNKRKKYASNQIYQCPLCAAKFESAQQRYLHCGIDHLVLIPMIEGCPQSATNGSELLLIQLTMKRNNSKTGVPEYLWRGEQEQKSFWSILRNAEKQDQRQCQGYVWQRLHDENYVPTKKLARTFTFHKSRGVSLMAQITV